MVVEWFNVKLKKLHIIKQDTLTIDTVTYADCRSLLVILSQSFLKRNAIIKKIFFCNKKSSAKRFYSCVRQNTKGRAARIFG